MKKKFFTLLALVVGACNAAWAEDTTVLSFNSGTLTGATATYAGTGSLDGDKYKFGNGYSDGTNYVELTLSSGSFATNDKISVTYYAGNTSRSCTPGFYFGTKTDNGFAQNLRLTASETSAGSDNPATAELTITEDGNGTNILRLGRDTGGTGLYITVLTITRSGASEAFTVTFEVGDNGTCATSSLTEASVGAGVELPAVSTNTGYVFNGWYTASSGGSLAGLAGATYYPTANTTLYAQYSSESVAAISVSPSDLEVTEGASVSFTVTATGSPVPTIQWYSNTANSNEGGTPITGATTATYSFTAPAFDEDGTNVYYYYAVATNTTSGGENTATSEVATLTVNEKPQVAAVSNKFWKISDLGLSDGATIEESTLYDSNTIEIAATSDNKATIKNSSYTIGGQAFTQCVQFGGGGAADSKHIHIKVTGPSVISAYALSSNKSTARDVRFGVGGYNSNTNIVSGGAAGYDATTKNASVYEYTGGEADIYISSASSGAWFYGVKVEPLTESVTPANAKSTYVTTKAMDFSSVEGLTAYVAESASESGVVMKSVTTVPAETPLMLIGTAETEYSVPVVASAAAPETNLLRAGDGTTIFSDASYDYILYDGLFYRVTSGTVSTTKAYLHLDSEPASAGALNVIFDDEAASITAVAGERQGASAYYNLNGQRVAQPAKGLYIVNGKKVIIK